MNLIEPPDGRPWALIGLCAGSLLLNALLAIRLVTMDAPSAEEASPTPAEVVAAVEAPAPAAAPMQAAVQSLPDVQVVRAPLTGSFAATFAAAAPKDHAEVLTAVYNRLFMWDVDVRKDLQPGDLIEVAYEWDGPSTRIPVAAFTSQKLGKRMLAYAYRAAGDEHASWWDETGREVPYRLVDGPMAQYEQITSLVRDGRGHHGMDFKAPEGTPVTSPRGGKVIRVNWNHTYNGNCVELQQPDGSIARFLHLSRTDVEAGQTLAAGAALGLSGNTGRSTAPHLHYEIEKNGRIVDPRDAHGVVRRVLPETELAAFAAERARLDATLNVGLQAKL